MMTTADELITTLSEIQTADGAFPSDVYWEERRYEDRNGFTTALVLRALHDVPASAARDRILTRIRERALGFLLNCEDTDLPGTFRFWPSGAQPEWIREPLPPDADDTAIYGLELARNGYLDQRAMLRIACASFARRRLRNADWPAPPWLRPGVFLTWLRRGANAEIVDCCANANVVAFLNYAGLRRLPGFREACAMIEAGIRWAGGSWERARSLSPFYAHPVELRYAVENAVRCGAESLAPSLALMKDQRWAMEAGDGSIVADRPICSNAYGRVLWTSAAVQIARKIGRLDELSTFNSKSPSVKHQLN
ncbi:MAG: hypothetical protein ACREAB_02265 [Blastocatellia bacterium]